MEVTTRWHCHACDRDVIPTFTVTDGEEECEPVCSECGVEGFLLPITPDHSPVSHMERPQGDDDMFSSFFDMSGHDPSSSFSLSPVPNDPRIAMDFPFHHFVQAMTGGTGGGVHIIQTSNGPPGGGGPGESTQWMVRTLGGPAGTPFNFQNFIDRAFGGAMTFLSDEAFQGAVQFIMENDPNRHGSPPTAARLLSALPEEKLIDEMRAAAEGECAICQEKFKQDDTVLRIRDVAAIAKEDEEEEHCNCTHTFHVECIRPWLSEHNSCPVCRYELPTDDESYERRKREVRRRLREQGAHPSRTQSM